MKVLFIGGTGIISSACSELALQQGIELYLLNRGKSFRPAPAGAVRLQGDIHQPASVTEALGDLTFDAVVEWIAFTPEQAESGYRAVPQLHPAVHFYQLGIRIPETPQLFTHHGKNAALQPILAVFAQ